jgi:DNA-binding response OmpR family regulator
MRVLIVEDNRDLAANIGEYLEDRAETVDYATDGLTGLHLAATQSYDAIVLDLGLPALDGISLCKRLRLDAQSPVPVLMLTARDTERDKLSGFDVGADDYLTKPFSLPEMHARLKALVRRGCGARHRVLRIADLEFDTHTLIARRGGRRVELTPSGIKLLETLMRASPGVVVRRDVEYALWGDDPPESEAALRGHIHALRAALDQGEPAKLLHTVHGMGYRLAADDEA